MRIFLDVRDDLRDYAESVFARTTELLSCRPIDARDFGRFDCVVLHRLGKFQTELVRIRPGVVVAPHVHPTVDAIDLGVAGDADLVVDGKRFAEGYPPERRARLLKRIGIRIGAGIPHGGRVGKDEFVFLSCQRWIRPPEWVALDWLGKPVSQRHAKLLEDLVVIS